MENKGFLIELKGVGMSYPSLTGPIRALEDISFAVRGGEFISLLGPSGCGKSTLLLLVSRLLRSTEGQILIDGVSPEKPLKNVGFVFQDHLLLDWRTALDNILLQLEMRHLDRKAGVEKARALMDLVGLAGFEHKYPHELSGGMQQRVSICRALIHDPEILLMDEPFGALDALTREQIRLDLERIWSTQHNTVLFVTHDVNEAILLSDRVLVLSPRPGTIRREFVIDLPRPRRLEITQTDRFMAYRREIIQLFTEMGILRG